MPIKLVSLSRRPQTFNLVCRGTRVRRDTFEHDPATGQRHTRRGYIHMPSSVSIAAKGKPGHRSKLLPDEAADEAEIAGAKRNGLIKIIHVTSVEAEAEKKKQDALDAKAKARAEKKSLDAKKKRDAAIAAKRKKAKGGGKKPPAAPPKTETPDASKTDGAATNDEPKTETRGRRGGASQR